MTARQLVRRAIGLSRRYADSGNPVAARKTWLVASRMSLRCGGISGATWAGGGYGAIVLEDGLVAISPVPLAGRYAKPGEAA